jgi:hypothetical protein
MLRVRRGVDQNDAHYLTCEQSAVTALKSLQCGDWGTLKHSTLNGQAPTAYIGLPYPVSEVGR